MQRNIQMLMDHYQHNGRFYQVGVVLLFLGLLLTSFVWTPRAAAAPASSVLTLNVQPYPTPFTVYEAGLAMKQVVATGTDNLGPGDPITATIDWGDKTTPTQQTFIDGRTFQITGAHAYSKVGTYTITVTAAITAFQQSVTGTGTITVVPPYALNVQSIKPAAGQVFNGVVALGTDPFPNDALKGTVDWGDNTPPTSVQTVSAADGTYQLHAMHAYSQVGSRIITVSLSSIIVGPITGTGTATVVTPAFTLSGHNISVRARHRFTATVATVTGTISVKGLHVSINWGDGTTSMLNQRGGTRTFDVKGSHTYNKAGSYPITISVQDNGTGETATAMATATVA